MNKISFLHVFMIMVTTITATMMLTASSVAVAAADSLGSPESESGPTFTSEGSINSLTGNNYTWLLGGEWNFQSINGITDSFNVDMTMIASNGTMRHHMLITNFTQSENNQVNMTDDGTININGTSDIYGHGKLKWAKVPSEISIDEYSVLHLFVNNNQTQDHFNGGIHGITNSFTYGFNFNKDPTILH